MDLITNRFSPLFEYTYPDELISIDPEELDFLFELNKPMLSSFRLSNNSAKLVAFRVKTTNLKKYSVHPKKVTMQALEEAPSILECNDMFLVQCVAPPAVATLQDITPEMFDKDSGNHVEEYKLSADFVVPSELEDSEEETSENATAFNKAAGNHVEECKLRAAYVAPPVPEDSEEETSENDTSVSEGSPEGSSDHQIASSKANDIISMLTEGNQSIIQENNSLLMEMFKDLMATLAKDPHSFMRRSKRLQDELLKDLISTFTNEKLSIIQENKRFQDKLVKDVMSMLTKQKQSIIQEINSTLKKEVEILKRGSRRNNDGGRLSIYVLLIVVLGILLVHKFRSSWLSLDFL